jgi:hypothetical protein
MAALLKIVDEHFGSGTPRREAVELRLASELVTAREIILRRVEAEIEEIERSRGTDLPDHQQTRSFLIGVEPGSRESALNPRVRWSRRFRPLDAAAEGERAVKAFQQNKFIMLLDDRQLGDVDAPVPLMPESELVFLYLTPLKGG